MKVKVCDCCGKQMPYRDLVSEKTQKYTVKMHVGEDFFGQPTYDRILNFCPECKSKVENFLDELLRSRPEVVQVNLYDE